MKPHRQRRARPWIFTDLHGFASDEETERVLNPRQSVAKVLGAKPTEIVFNSGGTEGDNIAIQGVLRAHPASQRADRIENCDRHRAD